MNIMNFMKHFRGEMGIQEKKHVFFSFTSALGLFSCSFCFITFINFTTRMVNAASVAIGALSTVYFMNIMKVYEEGVFMAIFCKRRFICSEFMNFFWRRTS
jgi:hypothetical protein